MQERLKNLKHLTDVLSSSFLCRRQSVLLLLDEVSKERCSHPELSCDNCSNPTKMACLDVTNEVLLVSKHLENVNIDSPTLSKILSGYYQPSVPNELCESLSGILSHWPKWAVMYFIDFMMWNELIVKDFEFQFDSPACILKTMKTQQITSGSRYHLHVPLIHIKCLQSFQKNGVLDKLISSEETIWRSNVTRRHSVNKRRFHVKQSRPKQKTGV